MHIGGLQHTLQLFWYSNSNFTNFRYLLLTDGSGVQDNLLTTSISGANDHCDLAIQETIPATLPAASGANLTNLPAANITGTLQCYLMGVGGANLTNLDVQPCFNDSRCTLNPVTLPQLLVVMVLI